MGVCLSHIGQRCFVGPCILEDMGPTRGAFISPLVYRRHNSAKCRHIIKQPIGVDAIAGQPYRFAGSPLLDCLYGAR